MGGKDDTLRLSDGRSLAFAQYGDPAGFPVLYCHGFPGSRLEAELSAPAAALLGVRIFAPDRPGFGLSDPQPRRTLADWPRDAAELADALELRRFAVLGVSGGAPYALACASLLPRRVAAVSVVCGLGPVERTGDAAGMLPLHRLLFFLFRRLPPFGRILYLSLARRMRRNPGEIFRLLTGKAPPPDRATLTRPEVRRIFVRSYEEAFRRGYAGGARELLLYSRPWDFSLADVAAPVSVWHGEEDATVPAAMGRRLARALPQARTVFLPREGHFSLPVGHAEAILRDLRDASEPLGRDRLPVFVYGTLRPGGKNYPRYLEGRTVREMPATAEGELFFVAEGGYPYVVPGTGEVQGELVEIDPALYGETLRDLDGLEEYDPKDEAGSVYLRRRTSVRLADGKVAEAWIYYWNGLEEGVRIGSGDFRRR